jgi:aldehyde dehydrogenase (NAD+)
MEDVFVAIDKMRQHFDAGHTKAYQSRIEALEKLKSSLLSHEQEIYDALYADLKKSPEEVWVTETGFLLTEINHAIRKLKKWMAPQKVKTNLLNLPSKSFIYTEPLGVVLIVGPWNYPLQISLTPLVGAIAAGNCCIVKPSEFAAASSAVIGKIISRAFIPEQVYVLQGDGASVIPPLMEKFRFDHIFFTGSIRVGRIMYEQAAKKLTPVTLELSGKSPCVVESDANIKVAARRIAQTKFSNAGQMCVAPDYLLIHESVKEKLVAELVKYIGDFYDDPATSYNYGRIVNRANFERLSAYLRSGKILYGGKTNADDLYIEPTLLENVSEDDAVMGEEIFGPVLPILTFRNFEEAKAIIGKHRDPLAFYVFTSSAEKEKLWLESIPFGGGCVNNASWQLTNPYLPFGGRGNSGLGRYHGKFSYDTFSHHKAVMKTPTWFDPGIKYPPFKGKLNLFKKFIR